MNPLVRTPHTKHKKNAIAAAITCGILLVLSGCGIPKLRGPEPGRPLPDSFNGEVSAENSAQIGITEFFNDQTLTDLINQGLAGNQNLKILAQNIAIANNEVLRRRGAYLPFVTYGGPVASLNKYSANTLTGADNAQDLLPNGSHFPQPLPDFLVGGQFSWQVDIWRQLRNARDAEVFRYFGTRDGWNYALTRLIADIAENYYELMALDQQIQTLDRIIALQEASLERAKALKLGAQGTELGVQRFLAEVRKNQSQKLIIRQTIIETENRINFLVGRFPQPVERDSTGFFDLNLHALSLGVPAQLLQNRPDVREAERKLAAAGLDVRVARANFYPKLFITGGVGYEAFNTKYLFVSPESLIYNAAGDLVGPLINKTAIKADYRNANAMQLQSVYDYQRIVLNAFTEVINRVSKVQNYSRSIEIKRQQLRALEESVDIASKLFQNARVQYMDVLFAQRDLMDARMVFIETKQQQLSAIVNTYQALGGGIAPNIPRRLPPVPGGLEGVPMPEPIQMEDLPPGDAPPAGQPDNAPPAAAPAASKTPLQSAPLTPVKAPVGWSTAPTA
jgi:NodT family efflux transporter outer membrane factor (OMF) lipoprotein